MTLENRVKLKKNIVGTYIIYTLYYKFRLTVYFCLLYINRYLTLLIARCLYKHKALDGFILYFILTFHNC